MKKKIAGLLGALMITSSISFAALANDQIALGGITPGSTLDRVKSIYGEPTQVSDDEYQFGTGFVVEVKEHDRNIVEKVVTFNNNGIKTPEGVRVGMNESAIESTYGRPDKIDRDTYDTEYKYRSQDHQREMEFKVVNGIIVKIKVELND